MSGVAEVYHCAALKHVELCEYNPFETIKTNEGTQNLIEVARYARVKKVLLASSDKAANPTSIMGTTKLCCEKLIVQPMICIADGISFACVRFGNVWNTNGSVGHIFKKQVKNGVSISLTDPNMTRFFISLKGAIELCVNACNEMVGGEIFVSHMIATSMQVIAEEFKKYNDTVQIEVIGSKAGEKLFAELFTETESVRTYGFQELYVIVPPVLRDDIGRHEILKRKYLDGQSPINEALRSDINENDRSIVRRMVSEVMNE